MMFKAVATFATVLVLSSAVQANSIRNDLRITGGICQQPKEDRCSGRSTRNEASDILFQRLGRTERALLDYKFEILDKAAGCTNYGKFNGYQWVDSSANPISHAVLLDTKGTVAGLQFFMPYSEVNLTAELNYRYDKQPIIQNLTISGVKYFYMTVYFVDPQRICTSGRDENQLKTEGTVSKFFIQNGPSPNYVKQLALTSPPKSNDDEKLLIGWNDNNCYRYMGWHRFFDQESWKLDSCTTFVPFFLMYSNEGHLNGFGFVVPGKASSKSIERPPLPLTMWTAGANNGTDNVPKCLEEAQNLLGMSSMHVFFSERPYEFTCSNVEDAAPRMTNRMNSNEGYDSYDYATGNSWSIFNWSPRKAAVKALNIMINGLRETINWISPSGRSGRTSSDSDSEFPICVVGAGFSGIGVALELKDKHGRNVEVFEKEDHVGGKVKTFRRGSGSDEVQVDMCPLLISNVSYKIIKYIEEFKLNAVEFDENDRKGYDFDYMVPLDIPRDEEKQHEINEGVMKYLEIYSKMEEQLAYGYLNIKSEELYDPMVEWLEKKDLQVLRGLITMLITTQGYGNLNEVPALYVLQLLDKYKMASLANPEQKSFFYVKEGLDTLIKKIAAKLGDKLHLNHKVTGIERKNNKLQIIKFGNGKEQKCSNVVLAFPPLLSSIRKIMPLDTEEIKVLEQVKIHKYTSSALIIPSWNSYMYVEAFKNNSGEVQMYPPRGIGEPTAFLKQSIPGGQQGVYSAYSWLEGDFHSIASDDELNGLIKDKLQQSLDKVDRIGGGKSKILELKNPEYFPHVNSTSLKNNFYRKFDRIQGKNGIYYATTLPTFEIMEKALQMAEIVAKRIDVEMRNN